MNESLLELNKKRVESELKVHQELINLENKSYDLTLKNDKLTIKSKVEGLNYSTKIMIATLIDQMNKELDIVGLSERKAESMS